MTINIESRAIEAGSLILAQYGIRYPDGTIHWADVNPKKPIDQTVRTESKSYYVCPSSPYSSRDLTDLQARHAQRQEQTHDKPVPLVLVKRTVVVATTEVEHVRSLAAD